MERSEQFPPPEGDEHRTLGAGSSCVTLE